MNNIDLKLINCANFKPSVEVDGNTLQYKKDNFGALTTQYTTDKSQIKIEINKYYDVLGPWWFLTSLFFFIISIFGILDIRPDKKCISLKTTFLINVRENSKIKIVFKTRKNGEKAVEVTCENAEITQEEGNTYYVEEQAKKRYKVLRVTKVFMWLGVIALSAYALVNYMMTIFY